MKYYESESDSEFIHFWHCKQISSGIWCLKKGSAPPPLDACPLKNSLRVGDSSKNASARLNFTPLTNPWGGDL